MEYQLFKFAFDMAFRDATLRKAFPKNEEEYGKNFQERKERVKNKSMEFVKKYIDDLFDKGPIDPKDTIISICNACRDDGFTFGNSQKLVNMTAKYMFLSTYGDKEKRLKFQKCHCPMDSVMVELVKKKDKTFKCDVGWSRLEYANGNVPKVYDEFQEVIKRLCGNEKINDEELNIYPIEFDYLYWDNE